MPIPGLSLVGFMDEQDALNYLSSRCILPDKSLSALRHCWLEARQKLGEPIPNAGYPDIQDIPKNYKSYLQGVVNKNPRYPVTVGNLQASFKLVEIDTLLAYQFHVETERITDPFGATGELSISKQLELCLPQKVDEVPRGYEFPQENSVLVKTSDVNIDVLGKGSIGGNGDQKLNALGIVYGLKSPLVQVVRYNGRCFLKNGFHRAYLLKRVGIKYIPCLFLEGGDYKRDVNPADSQVTFSQVLLESDNPPTCGHYSEDRAYPVTLRGISRYIYVNWSVYNLLDEE